MIYPSLSKTFTRKKILYIFHYIFWPLNLNFKIPRKLPWLACLVFHDHEITDYSIYKTRTHSFFFLCKRHIIFYSYSMRKTGCNWQRVGGVNTDRRMHQFNWHDWTSSCFIHTFTHSHIQNKKTPPHALHWSHNNIFPDLHENVDEISFFLFFFLRVLLSSL